MFVDATNQLTWRSHVQFKGFIHEKEDQKKKCNRMILLCVDNITIYDSVFLKVEKNALIEAEIFLEY